MIHNLVYKFNLKTRGWQRISYYLRCLWSQIVKGILKKVEYFWEISKKASIENPSPKISFFHYWLSNFELSWLFHQVDTHLKVNICNIYVYVVLYLVWKHGVVHVRYKSHIHWKHLQWELMEKSFTYLFCNSFNLFLMLSKIPEKQWYIKNN